MEKDKRRGKTSVEKGENNRNEKVLDKPRKERRRRRKGRTLRKSKGRGRKRKRKRMGQRRRDGERSYQERKKKNELTTSG